jgi:hypothetical protein
MQFVERPNDIPTASYALSDSFQSQCHKYGAYSANAPFPLLGGDSGLKVRRDEDVVRRSERASKRYLSQNLKRGLGDSHHQHGHY